MSLTYEHFKDKLIYDVDKEELLWLKKNSFINEYPFYGKLHQLNNINVSCEELSQNLKTLEEFVTNSTTMSEIQNRWKAYSNTKSFDDGMDFFLSLILLIEDMVNKKNIFYANEKFQRAFGNIYLNIYMIEIISLKPVLERFGPSVRWQLWPEPLVRFSEKYIPLSSCAIIRAGCISAELGNYEKAIDLFAAQMKDWGKEKVRGTFKVQLSPMYYILVCLNKLNRQNDLIQLINYVEFLESKNLYIFDDWNLSILKLSLFYLNAYEYIVDLKLLKKYQEVFFKAIYSIRDAKSRFGALSEEKLNEITNNSNSNIIAARFNVELVREYFLNSLTYSYITGIFSNEKGYF